MSYAKRPKAIVCYVCGQQFGTASIGIHVPRCIDKWEKIEAKKPPKERRPVPPAPQNFDNMIKGNASGNYDNDTYNQEAFDHFNTVALVPCGCGRTFLPDSLVKHQKTCKSANLPVQKSGAADATGGGSVGAIGSKSLGTAGANLVKKPPGALRPKALMCYICGREYGTASLEIHLKTCKKKWDIEQEKKPKNQRRPCPEPPKDIDETIAKAKSGNMDFESYNEAAFDNYNNKALEPCNGCGRTFNPDALLRHQPQCLKKNGKSMPQTSPSPSGRTLSNNGADGGLPPNGNSLNWKAQSEVKRPKALVCYICGREFGTASLEIHLKTCKKKWEAQEAQKPLRMRKPLPLPPKEFDNVEGGI